MGNQDEHNPSIVITSNRNENIFWVDAQIIEILQQK